MESRDRTYGREIGLGAGRALDAGQIVAAVLKSAGRGDFVDRSFYRPLQRLIASCNSESDLNPLGRSAVRHDIRRSLRNLLELECRERELPSVLSRPIERPIFITGMPRSGSTFLHRLLVQDPATAAPLSWQLVYPYPCPTGRLGDACRRAGVQAQFYLMRLLAPRLNALHHIAASEPEECTDITAQVFQSLRYDSVYRVPSYQSWLQRHGHLDAYRFHKRFLQHLDSQVPGRRWILKSPDHIFALDDIRSVYPDARFVFIHRDPVAVLASVAKLTEVLRRPFTYRLDLEEIGRQVCASWLDGAQRMMKAADTCDSILHLHYREIVGAPQEAAERVFRHAALRLDERTAQRMQKWLASRSNRHHRQGEYRLATFGLDPDVLRAKFAPYTDRFGIDLECRPGGRAVRPRRT